MLGGITQILQSVVLTRLPVGSDAAAAVRKAINEMAKFAPPGGAGQNQIPAAMQQFMMQQRQNAPQIAAMRAAQTQPPGGGAAPPMAA
jgi:tetrahydromethanopterin S-methyltransferase subunit H